MKRNKRILLSAAVIVFAVTAAAFAVYRRDFRIISDETGEANAVSALKHLQAIAGESKVTDVADLKRIPDNLTVEDYLIKNSIFSLDEETMDRTVQTYLTGAESTAAARGLTAEQLIVGEWGYESVESYRQKTEEELDRFVKLRLAVYETAKDRHITISAKEYEEMLEDYAAVHGYEDAGTFAYECRPSSIADEMLYDKTLNALVKDPKTESGGAEADGIYVYAEEDQKLLKRYQEYNGDVVGLIRIPGTVLNHPLAQTPADEEYYLNRDLDRKYNSHGVPFLSARSRLEDSDNVVVFGHNIHLQTRDVFADLAGYEDIAFYREHPVIETVSESGTRRWMVFAYFIVDNADKKPFRYSEVTEFPSLEKYNDYFREVDRRNWLSVPLEHGIEDKYLTLSSCSNELAGSGTNRMVVIARQLGADEGWHERAETASMTEKPLLPKRLQSDS